MYIGKLLAGWLTNNQEGLVDYLLSTGIYKNENVSSQDDGHYLEEYSCFVTFLSLGCLAFAGVCARTGSSLFTEAAFYF